MKKKGSIEYIISLFLVSLVSLLILFFIKTAQVRTIQNQLEDGLDSSCLAALLINRERYGSEGKLSIDDFLSARNQFCQSLEHNFNGLPEIDYQYDQFIVYNPVQDKIIYSKGIPGEGVSNGIIETNSAYTPNGKKIVAPTIYVRIKITENGLNGEKITSFMESCADVCEN